MAHTEFEQKLANLVNAGFPYVYISSYEEERVIRSIERALADRTLIRSERKLYIWTMTGGLTCGDEQIADTLQAPAAIHHIRTNQDNAIYILKDFHVFFGADRNSRPDHAVIRYLRELLPELKSSRKMVISSRRP